MTIILHHAKNRNYNTNSNTNTRSAVEWKKLFAQCGELPIVQAMWKAGIDSRIIKLHLHLHLEDAKAED